MSFLNIAVPVSAPLLPLQYRRDAEKNYKHWHLSGKMKNAGLKKGL